MLIIIPELQSALSSHFSHPSLLFAPRKSATQQKQPPPPPPALSILETRLYKYVLHTHVCESHTGYVINSADVESPSNKRDDIEIATEYIGQENEEYLPRMRKMLGKRMTSELIWVIRRDCFWPASSDLQEGEKIQ